MNQLLLNSSNYDKNTNSLKYLFPIPQTLNDMQVGISDLTLYNQFFNISATYNNNSITIVDPLANTYSYTIPDGFYTIADFNTFLQTQLLSSSLYTTVSGVKTYPIVFSQSTTSKQNQIMLNPINNGYCYINWSANLSRLFGFFYSSNNNRFPNVLPSGSSTSITYIQNVTADLYKVNSIYLTCNLISNMGFASINNILIGVPTATTNFGSLISLGESHNTIDFLNVNKGMYNYIEIQFFDQDFNSIKLIDTNLLLCLAFITEKK